MEKREIKIDFGKEAKALLAEKGFDQNLGARPLKRAIQKKILDPLSLKIVGGEIKRGDRIFIDVEGGQMIFQIPRLLELKKKKSLEKTSVK